MFFSHLELAVSPACREMNILSPELRSHQNEKRYREQDGQDQAEGRMVDSGQGKGAGRKYREDGDLFDSPGDGAGKAKPRTARTKQMRPRQSRTKRARGFSDSAMAIDKRPFCVAWHCHCNHFVARCQYLAWRCALEENYTPPSFSGVMQKKM